MRSGVLSQAKLKGKINLYIPLTEEEQELKKIVEREDKKVLGEAKYI